MESKQNLMKSGVCPNCGSAEIYSGAELTFKGGYHNAIPITLFGVAELDNYVCADCGFVESYIGDRAKLAAIKDKWKKVK